MFTDTQSGPLSGPSWRVGLGPFAHLVEHPVADRHDEAGLLGDVDELARRHQPAHRVLPAQERLLGHAFAGWEIELRLEQHAELVALERLAESPLGEEAGHGLGVHRLVEQLVARAAAALRAVHRGVGVAKEARGAIRGRARDRDADAGGDDDLGVRERERLTERPDRAVGDLLDLALVGEVLAHHDELVAAESRDGVVAPDGRRRVVARPRRAARRPCRARDRR